MDWFRYYSDDAGSKQLKRAERLMKATRVETMGVWSILLCAASDSPVRGRLMLTSHKPMSIEDIADALDMDEARTLEWLNALRDAEALSNEGGVIVISDWDKRQYASDKSTDRVHKFRENAKRFSNVSETPTVVSLKQSETPPDTDTDTEKGDGANAPAPRSPLIDLLEKKFGVGTTSAAHYSQLDKIEKVYKADIISTAMKRAIAEGSRNFWQDVGKFCQWAEADAKKAASKPEYPPPGKHEFIVHGQKFWVGDDLKYKFEDILDPDMRLKILTGRKIQPVGQVAN
jgi:hypothetical protein